MGELIAVESAWEYQSAANSVPSDPFSETVPASGWTSGGVTPFGTIGSLVVETEVATSWPLTEGLWIRRNFTVTGNRDVVIRGMVANTAFIYIDGDYFGVVNQTEDIRLAEFVANIPNSIVDAGTHEIALLCLDMGGDSTYVYVEADYAPCILPFQPAATAEERLEWFTDLKTAKDGTEERDQVILAPVQFFEYTFPLTPARKSKALNTIYGGRALNWFVPVWSQARLHGAVTSNQVLLTSVDINYAEFRNASFVLLWESDENWQILGVDLVQATSFTLVGLTNTFSNAWLMPLREAVLDSEPSRAPTGYEDRATLSYRVVDNKELTVSPPTQYNSDDSYTEAYLIDGEDRQSFISGIEEFDPGYGLLKTYDFWSNVKLAKTYRIVCNGQAEAWAFRQYLHRRAGRFRQFWMPSFENDLRLVSTGTINATINIHDDSYLAYSEGRDHIAVETSSGWLFRSVVSSLALGGGITELTLSSALSIAANSVRRICWLGLHRHSQDSVQIRYVGNNVALSEFRILELSP